MNVNINKYPWIGCCACNLHFWLEIYIGCCCSATCKNAISPIILRAPQKKTRRLDMPGRSEVARRADFISSQLAGGADEVDILPAKIALPAKSASPSWSAVLARCPLFSGLSANERSEILSEARAREFDRSEVLYFEGDPVEEILLLLSGYVKHTKFGESGTVAILGLAGPGDALGAASLISTGQYTTTAEPVQRCRALAWRAPSFKTYLERSPVLYRNMFRIHLVYLRELEERFREMATEMVSRRVARQLVRLHDLFGSIDDPSEIRLSQEELAQMTGTTLFSISRLLTEWEARGLIVTRRHSVTVRKVDSLRGISE
jgi:CRP-like cAMP-binding protein